MRRDLSTTLATARFGRDDKGRVSALLLLLATAIGCAPTEPVADPEAGVPRTLAVARAERIEGLHYDVHLSIPTGRHDPIRGRLAASFELADGDRSLAFDFAQEPANVLDVRVQGVSVGHRVEAEHVVVPADVLTAGKMAIEIDFLAGDGSLNRHDEYLYTLFVPDRARVALPVFDQPDLKATWSLELEVPSGWKAVANGALEHRSEGGSGERANLVFARTRPLPTYLFAFAAGALEVVEAQRGGRTLRMLHRETDDRQCGDHGQGNDGRQDGSSGDGLHGGLERPAYSRTWLCAPFRT